MRESIQFYNKKGNKHDKENDRGCQMFEFDASSELLIDP